VQPHAADRDATPCFRAFPCRFSPRRRRPRSRNGAQRHTSAPPRARSDPPATECRRGVAAVVVAAHAPRAQSFAAPPHESPNTLFSRGFIHFRRSRGGVRGGAEFRTAPGFFRARRRDRTRAAEKPAFFYAKALGDAAGLPYIPPCRGVI